MFWVIVILVIAGYVYFKRKNSTEEYSASNSLSRSTSLKESYTRKAFDDTMSCIYDASKISYPCTFTGKFQDDSSNFLIFYLNVSSCEAACNIVQDFYNFRDKEKERMKKDINSIQSSLDTIQQYQRNCYSKLIQTLFGNNQISHNFNITDDVKLLGNSDMEISEFGFAQIDTRSHEISRNTLRQELLNSLISRCRELYPSAQVDLYSDDSISISFH